VEGRIALLAPFAIEAAHPNSSMSSVRLTVSDRSLGLAGASLGANVLFEAAESRALRRKWYSEPVQPFAALEIVIMPSPTSVSLFGRSATEGGRLRPPPSPTVWW